MGKNGPIMGDCGRGQSKAKCMLHHSIHSDSDGESDGNGDAEPEADGDADGVGETDLQGETWK